MDVDIFQKVLQQVENIETDELHGFNAVLLPDFFVDHIVSFPDFKDGMAQIESCVIQGGGNMPGLAQVIQQGGNAANTALALSMLGISSHLICKTNDIGMSLLDFFLKRFGVDISHAKSGGCLASTVALEFGKNHSNVFLQDAGSVETFDICDLNDTDWELISSSDIVGVMNWSLNKTGTKLAKEVFSFAKDHDVLTYIDTGDPSPRSEDISNLIGTVLSCGLVDFFSLNENEIRRYSGISCGIAPDEILEAGSILLEKVDARLDIHTAMRSYSLSRSDKTDVQAVPLMKVCRATGAGDVWNAGNILGELAGFSSKHRIAFANLLAGCYISKKDPLPPTLEELCSFTNEIITREA